MRQKRPFPRANRELVKPAIISAQKPHSKKPLVLGYPRVSTGQQDARAQTAALKRAGCTRVYVDAGVSGSAERRPQLDALLKDLRAGDTLVVTALDRLGRSTSHLVATVHALAECGVNFRSLRETIDTGSAAGRLILAMFAALAAFERDLLRERTVEALREKRARGERLGRPRSLVPSQVRLAREMLARGDRQRDVANAFRVDVSTLRRALQRLP